MSIFSSSGQTLSACVSDGPCEPSSFLAASESTSLVPVCAPFVGGCLGLRLSAVMNVGRWEGGGVGCEGGVSSWEGGDVWVSKRGGGDVGVSSWEGGEVGCDSCGDVDGGS